MREGKKRIKKGFAVILALALLLQCSLAVIAGTWPYLDKQATGKNQPVMLGHRFVDIRDWSPETDPYAHTMRARVPIQERIDDYSKTQANPDLKSGPEVMYMAGDYGNSFNQGTKHTNEFSENVLGSWQYIDYYSSWHGAAPYGTPRGLWSAEHETTGSWSTARNFDFGSINMPNPAYTNAAHKNGVLSMGCVYFDPNNRVGQPAELMLEKDEDGNYIMAQKLIEFAEWYGFDGYFFNYEERITAYGNANSVETVKELKKVMKQVADAGLYSQQYDSLKNSGTIEAWESVYDDDDVSFVYDEEIGGSILDSIFVSYDWSASNKLQRSLDTFKKHNMTQEEIYEQVFFGVEASQGAMKTRGHNSTYNFPMLYKAGTKELVGSIALFTPDEFIHRQIDGSIGDGKSKNNNRAKDEYQWMAAERERMYFSGAYSDPTDTGVKAGSKRLDLGVSDTGGWGGVADFATERSVNGGSAFFTNFNTGHGLEYRVNGSVSNEEEWANINIQSIMPTWQWWIDTEGTKIGVDFDYGSKQEKFGPDMQATTIPYTQNGAFEGGSSLVIYGDLDADNRIHLYKTDLTVKPSSKANITFLKSSDDNGKLELALTFKDDDTVVYIPVEESDVKSDKWVTKEIDLSEYAGKEIASLDLAVKGTATDYQINIGEIKVTDGVNYTPKAPTNVKIDNAFDGTNEFFVSWNLDDYSNAMQYNVYANYKNGSKEFLGGIYDENFYIKSVKENIESLEVTAVGKDGSESAATKVDFDYDNRVSGIVVDEIETPKMDPILTENPGFFKQTARPGIIDASWTAPKSADFDSYLVEAVMKFEKDPVVYSMKVDKAATSAALNTPVFEGKEYVLTVSTMKDGVKGQSISSSGFMNDSYCATFDEGYVRVGSKLILHPPASTDWFRINLSHNGKAVNIPSKYNIAQKNMRGVSKLNGITLSSITGLLEVVLTDYSGNISETAYINIGGSVPVSETTIPNEALRNAIVAQVGSNVVSDIMAYTGDIDLTNLAIDDLTGLRLLENANKIDLTGNTFTTLFNGIGDNVKEVVVKNCVNLTEIPINTFENKAVEKIDITGCTGLEKLALNDSNIDTIVWVGDISLPNIKFASFVRSRIEFTKGTDERKFVDYLAEKIDVSYEGQRPNFNLELPEEITLYTIKGETFDYMDYIKEAINESYSLRGTLVSDLRKADFVDPSYDFDVPKNIPFASISIISKARENSTVIDLSIPGTYVANFLSVDGTVLATREIVVIQLNKTMLKKIIDRSDIAVAEGKLNGVMPSVVKEFNSALAHAKDVYVSTEGPQERVNDATLALVRAYQKLSWLTGDKDELEIAIWLGTEIEKEIDKYVEAGKAEFVAALLEARKVFADEDAVSEEIEPAVDALIETMLNLRYKVDKELLKKTIKEARSLDLSLYTAESVALFKENLAVALEYDADEELSVDDKDKVNAVVLNLKKGMVDLDLKGTVEPEKPGGTTADKVAATTSRADEVTKEKADKVATAKADKTASAPKTGETSIALLSFLILGIALVSVLVVKKQKRNN